MSEEKSLKNIVESILFVSEKPLSAAEVLKIILAAEISETETPEQTQETEQNEQPEESKVSRSDVQQAIHEIQATYQDPSHGFELVNIAEGFQFRTKVQFSAYIKAMTQVSPTRLSQASLESLSMVAYRQPITRAEIDQMRGVDSGGVLKTLLDRELIRIVGKKEEPGKPLLYGTTDLFLETFNLKNLQDLPTLKDLRQIEDEMHQQNASKENTVPLDSQFFEESELTSNSELISSFSDLQADEEETFRELEEKINLVDSLEQEVLISIVPQSEKVEEPSS